MRGAVEKDKKQTFQRPNMENTERSDSINRLQHRKYSQDQNMNERIQINYPLMYNRDC